MCHSTPLCNHKLEREEKYYLRLLFTSIIAIFFHQNASKMQKARTTIQERVCVPITLDQTELRNERENYAKCRSNQMSGIHPTTASCGRQGFYVECRSNTSN